MVLRIKYVNFVLVMVLLLTGFFASTAYAQCPGTRIYFNTQTGDNTNNGTSDADAFKDAQTAMQAAASCEMAVTIYKNNRPWRQIPAPIPEGTGFPLAESLLIGGLVLLAVLCIGGALVLRRRSTATS